MFRPYNQIIKHESSGNNILMHTPPYDLMFWMVASISLSLSIASIPPYTQHTA